MTVILCRGGRTRYCARLESESLWDCRFKSCPLRQFLIKSGLREANAPCHRPRQGGRGKSCPLRHFILASRL